MPRCKHRPPSMLPPSPPACIESAEHPPAAESGARLGCVLQRPVADTTARFSRRKIFVGGISELNEDDLKVRQTSPVSSPDQS